MIYAALALLGFGVADLVRWSPGPVGVVHAVAAALSGTIAVAMIAALGGALGSWYEGLGFGFADEIPAGQFVLGAAAALFLLASSNRLVRLTLLATESSLLDGEGTLRGGRVLGPMERLIVAAAVVSGGVAAAGFVIAAKGLLRFREIRGGSEATDGADPRVDEVTEYFLIGTFTSVLIAAALSVLVLAAG